MKLFPLIVAGVLALTSAAQSEQVWVASKAFAIDRLFLSMQGPIHYRTGFTPLEKGENAWITGMKVELVGERGEECEQDMFCHANLYLAPKEMANNTRLMTLIPGRTAIRLPEGFGLKITGNDPLELYQQALNLDPNRPKTSVRFKTTLDFERKPKRELEIRNALVLLPLKDYERPEEICAAPTMAATLRSACAPSVAMGAEMAQNTNDLLTLHWMVPPGKHEFRTVVNEQLGIKGKVMAHYVTGHLHPYGDKLKLLEKKTQKEVFSLGAGLDQKGMGVGHVEDWASLKGVELDGSKEYELVAEYNNPTAKPIDAMGIIYVYTAKNSARN